MQVKNCNILQDLKPKIGHLKRLNSADQNIMYSIATGYNCLTGDEHPVCSSRRKFK